MIAWLHSVAFDGIDAVPIDVEVDVARRGFSGATVVGLPDTAVKESIDRVRSAMQNSGFQFPRYRTVVNLAPADLRKEGPLFDLPIALGILCANGDVVPEHQRDYMVLGELALDGRVRSIRGALSAALLARERGMKGILVPQENAREASVVDGIEVVPVTCLTGRLKGTQLVLTAGSDWTVLPFMPQQARVAPGGLLSHVLNKKRAASPLILLGGMDGAIHASGVAGRRRRSGRPVRGAIPLPGCSDHRGRSRGGSGDNGAISMTAKDRRLASAYHEAGHCVYGESHNWPVGEVAVPSEGLPVIWFTKGRRPITDPDRIAVYLAGPVAESFYLHGLNAETDFDGTGADDDLNRVRESLEAIYGRSEPNPFEGTNFRKALQEVRRELRREWPTVTDVAKALLAKQALNRREVRDIIQQSKTKKPRL